jgi:hypothetical protein
VHIKYMEKVGGMMYVGCMYPYIRRMPYVPLRNFVKISQNTRRIFLLRETNAYMYYMCMDLQCAEL